VWFGNDNYQSTRRLTGGRLPAMTWQRFMSYAHRNIELRPIPYIDNPLPGSEDDRQLISPEIEDDPDTVAVRPKLLSKEAEQKLQEIERLLRNAKPLTRSKQVAGAPSDHVVAQ
jgi:penicillin-binding protein 1A